MKHLKIYYFYCLYFTFFFFKSIIIWVSLSQFGGCIYTFSVHSTLFQGCYCNFLQNLARFTVPSSWTYILSLVFLMLGPLPSHFSQPWELFQVQPHIILCLLVISPWVALFSVASSPTTTLVPPQYSSGL